MLKQRTLHLAHCFRAIALSLGVPGLWVACSGGGSADQGSPDATAPGQDAAGPTDSSPSPEDSAPIGVIDAADVLATDTSSPDDSSAPTPCWATVTVLDAGPDVEETCIYALPCGLFRSNIPLAAVGCRVFPALSDGGVNEAAAATFSVCTLDQGEGCEDGGYVLPESGGVVFTCIGGCAAGGGRRPSGFRRRPARGATAAGAYLAVLARLEAASVEAFEVLTRELAVHGAPRALVEAARGSAEDEVRHAGAMGRLARRFGGVASAARLRPKTSARPVRSLAAIARENVVEGCVRETFGALLNAWQAARATDPHVRARMAEIARDELRHAALSWEIHAWAEAALPARERRSVERAKRRAVTHLIAGMKDAPSAEVRTLLGLPDEAEARALARGLQRRVWAAA